MDSRPSDQAARSLLQKALRRGDKEVALQVAVYLRAVKDGKWLTDRLWVIVVEECWVLLTAIRNQVVDGQFTGSALKENIGMIADVRKQKNAAGLGALAYAVSQAKAAHSIPHYKFSKDEQLAVRTVAESLRRSSEFWFWVEQQASGNETKREFVARARIANKRAGWPWDKLMASAAAYLALQDDEPPIEYFAYRQRLSSETFPYWVAIDRHTERGRNVLREIAREYRVPYEQLSWSSFYCEGARTHDAQPSHWFEKEAEWRLETVGLTSVAASQLWKSLKDSVRDRLVNDEEQLKQRIWEVVPSIEIEQGKLF